MRFEWQKHLHPSAFTLLPSPFCLLPSAFCLLLPATCLLLALPLRADVFWRLPKTAGAALEQMGGTRVYATDVQLNGAPGTLTAYAFGASGTLIGNQLSRRFGLPAPAPSGAALFTHAEKDRLRRFFVLPSPAGGDACVVLAFDQSLRDLARGGQKPPAWPEGLPPLSDATPVFSAVCALTRTSFVTADSPAAPETAAQEAARALRDAGWSEAAPATATFRIFVSGRKQCVLFAARNPQTERTTISLLQREGSTP